MKGRLGLSLFEAIVSIFVLMISVLMSVTLLHNSMRYQRMAKQRVDATILAERTLDEVRAWAREGTSGSYNYLGSWSIYQGVVRNVDSYRVRIDASPGTVAMASPCKTLEGIFGAKGRTMTSSVVPVRVRVEWDPPSPSNSVLLLTYIGEPPGEIVPPLSVTRTAGADPLPANGNAEFSVEALDAVGNQVRDLTFQWHVEPTGANPGMATMHPPWGPQFTPPVPPKARHGRTASLRNTVRLEDGSWDWSPGDVRVRVRTRLHGKDYFGEIPVQLAP